MQYELIHCYNGKYFYVCHVCFKNVIEENLVENGGTLHMPRLIFRSNAIIIATHNGRIVGCVAIGEADNEVVINQIAIKNDYKRKGIGKELINRIISYAGNRNISCHVYSFNLAFQMLFESVGFIKDEAESQPDRYAYKFYNKDYQVKKQA